MTLPPPNKRLSFCIRIFPFWLWMIVSLKKITLQTPSLRIIFQKYPIIGSSQCLNFSLDAFTHFSLAKAKLILESMQSSTGYGDYSLTVMIIWLFSPHRGLLKNGTPTREFSLSDWVSELTLLCLLSGQQWIAHKHRSDGLNSHFPSKQTSIFILSASPAFCFASPACLQDNNASVNAISHVQTARSLTVEWRF